MTGEAYERATTTKERLASISGELTEFVWVKVGRLLGFPWDEAVKVAKAWQNEPNIVPTGFNRPTLKGVLVDDQSAVKVSVPVYRMQYVRASDSSKVTNADSTMSELASMISAGLVVPQKTKSGEARATCYNLRSREAEAIAARLHRSPFISEVNASEKFEYPGCVFEAFEMAASYIGAESKYSDAPSVTIACEGAYRALNNAGTVEDGSDARFIIASAAMELLSYCGVFGGALNHSYQLLEVYGKTPMGALKSEVASFNARYTEAHRTELIEIMRHGHEVATYVARVMHDKRTNYSHLAHDNFDVLDELILEAMADRKLGEMSAAYVQQRFRDEA